MPTNMKRGQRVFIRRMAADFSETLEPATIVRRQSMTHYADGSDYPGWYVVRFNDGGRLCIHTTRMTVGNYAA
jgi:hypothetical protein